MTLALLTYSSENLDRAFVDLQNMFGTFFIGMSQSYPLMFVSEPIASSEDIVNEIRETLSKYEINSVILTDAQKDQLK